MSALDDAIAKAQGRQPIADEDTRMGRHARAQVTLDALLAETIAKLRQLGIPPTPLYDVTHSDYRDPDVVLRGDAWPLQAFALLEKGDIRCYRNWHASHPTPEGSLEETTVVPLGEGGGMDLTFKDPDHILTGALDRGAMNPNMRSQFPGSGYPLEDFIGAAIVELLRAR